MESKLRYAWWVVLFGLVILAIWKFFLPNNSSAVLQKSVSNREIVVYVSGAVEKPGLVHLAPDARLDDALQQVRPLSEANLENMNPAEKLKDGQKVSVPYKSLPASQGSAMSGNATNTIPVANQATAASSASTNGKININTAGATELDKLSGVGPALAERIIQYRTEHGPFARAEDLENVSGIGVKTYEKMASQVTVGP